MAIRKIKLPGVTTPYDIGVLSSNVIYDGDAGVTTTLNSKIQSIFTAIGDINSFEIALVNALPTENIDDHTIYFVPNSQDANTRDEYMYVNNQWELIGSTTIDLSDYPTYDDITVTQGLTTGIPAATITVGNTSTIIYSNNNDSVYQEPLLYGSGNMPIALACGETCTDSIKYSQDIKIQQGNGTSRHSLIQITDNGDFNKIALLDYNSLTLSDDNTSTHNLATISPITLTATRNYKLPDKSGTVALTSDIPSITATAGLTTGVTIGAIDINGTTTTLYAPEDTKVTQTDVSGSTTVTGFRSILLSENSANTTTIGESLRTKKLRYSFDNNILIVKGNGTDSNGGIYVQDDANHNQATLAVLTAGTTTTAGKAAINIGNNVSTGNYGNSKGVLLIYGSGNASNALFVLDTSNNDNEYHNYLPMTNGVLAAGVTTGVGSSTVPVYMAAGGELLACSLPTPSSYSLSMTGATITLLADNVAASTITLPIYDGTVTLTDSGVVG